MGLPKSVFGSRLLRTMGLEQGPKKDFTVDANSRDARTQELHTAFALRSPYAHRLVADYADFLTDQIDQQHLGLTISYDLSNPDRPIARLDDSSHNPGTRIPSTDPGHTPVKVRPIPSAIKYVDLENVITALYIPDPRHHLNPRQVLLQGDEPRYQGKRVLATMEKVIQFRGEPRRGWVVSSQAVTHEPITKAPALKLLRTVAAQALTT